MRFYRIIKHTVQQFYVVSCEDMSFTYTRRTLQQLYVQPGNNGWRVIVGV